MNAPGVSMLHPWNEAKAATFLHDRQRLPHALLFAGQKGTGKNLFATWIAQGLLCTKPLVNSHPCGVCQSCRLFMAGSHPDLHVVQPEASYKSSDTLLAQYAVRYTPADKSKESKDSTVIRIDQIRSLIHDSQTRPQIGACAVMLLSPADSMNINAANSLLKLLEEPPPDSFLILVADLPARLPATIRSRCARLEFHAPPQDVALTWLETQNLAGGEGVLLLELASGAPLAALALAESGFLDQRTALLDDMERLASGQGDPIACAARWKPFGANRCLLWLQGWLCDLIVTTMQVGVARLHNPDLSSRLQALEKRLDLRQLFQFSDGVARGRALLGGPLDEQLLLEDVLIRWTELCRR